MCGIFGNFIYEGALDLDASFNSLTQLKHRGPDGFGFEYGSMYCGDHSIIYNSAPSPTINNDKVDYFFGHRRLSIIDLSSNASQPMESFNRRYSIVFNGEIYNYIELKEELVILGCEFRTDHSDTEVILVAYDTWGTAFLDKLRGMFAFVIFDRINKTLFLARDKIGKKPLYFENTPSHIAFSSELTPLANLGPSRSINLEALNAYLAFGYVPHPHSIFDGIHKLPPASYAVVDLTSKSISINKYWDISGFTNDRLSKKDALENIGTLLKESVALRLRADVSVGAFISGGIDSTLMVKMASENGERMLDIYGADFPNTDRSEIKYINEAAKRYSQNLILSEIDVSHVTKIDPIISVFDEPFDGASSIAVFDLFRKASADHKVILTGDGGDEMFAGYERYLSFSKRYSLVKALKALLIPRIASWFLTICGVTNNKLAKLKTMLEGDLLDNYLIFNGDHNLTGLIKSEYKIANITNIEPFLSIRLKLKEQRFSIIKALQYIELKTILPGRMLYKIDRFSMFHSVEARSPLLDHKLAEYAFSIPDRLTVEDGVSKRLLKDILERDFDKDFIHRDKQGFGNPLSNWFQNSDTHKLFAILINNKSLIYNYLDFDLTHTRFPQIKGCYYGGQDKMLWRLLVLAKFLENSCNRIKH